jgi:hypothetical protein
MPTQTGTVERESASALVRLVEHAGDPGSASESLEQYAKTALHTPDLYTESEWSCA